MKRGAAMAFNEGIEVWFKQAQNTGTENYRNLIWDLFLTVVRETPQWSGLAVANWNLSIGQPDDMVYVTQADNIEPAKVGADHFTPAHQRGDTKWERVAWNRNRPIKNRIRYRDKVFITNNVLGQEHWSNSVRDFNYLEAMQHPGKWQDRLREVNKPYQNVVDSIIIVRTKFGSRGIGRPFVGGSSWEQE